MAVGTEGKIDASQLAHQLQGGLGSRRSRRVGDCQQLATAAQTLFLCSVGQEAEVPDAHEAVGQEVEQKTSDELFSFEPHGFQRIAVFAVAIGEGDLASVDGQKAMI